MNTSRKLLNLGCGSRISPGWTNVDFFSSRPEVLSHDLRKGIPFPENSFDLVYHSHVLEHFEKKQAAVFLQECFRVCKRGAVLRVAVPDLEQIARLYLEKLQDALKGSPGAADDYRWMMIELYDQCARAKDGGEALKYLISADIPNPTFVLSRWGVEAQKNITRARASESSLQSTSKFCLLDAIRPFYRFVKYKETRRKVAGQLRDAFLKQLLGSEWALLELGRFRSGGSIHQWMYDRFSLASLLSECGFTQVVQRSATESYQKEWASFNLDSEPNGSIYKPDSLFMEAIKP